MIKSTANPEIGDGPSATTTIIFKGTVTASHLDVTWSRPLMAHQMRNLCVFSLFSTRILWLSVTIAIHIYRGRRFWDFWGLQGSCVWGLLYLAVPIATWVVLSCHQLPQRPNVAVQFLQRKFPKIAGSFCLACRKWGLKRWGVKQIRGFPRKKASFLRFLHFPGALLRILQRCPKI